ncbi:alkaline phosphatase, tissue-nonspecific isozyme-like isoform X3 [Macrobrachium nipponense]|uniref:alkaline phosphatase, tissue-nonspecific isozyme-like isoform X3 n=1 Tax=Macrobrachium nipponense TaxID=159736 RepID=UPI0030C8309D
MAFLHNTYAWLRKSHNHNRCVIVLFHHFYQSVLRVGRGKMGSLHLVTLVVVLATGYSMATVFPRPSKDENDSEYWLKLGREEIEEALLKPELTNVAKNVILFLGDGFVTTTQVTHATLAAAYAKSASRRWQCDQKMKKFGQGASACKDIARQLVEDVPGKHIKVVMGGGRQEMGAPKRDNIEDNCKRTDGRNLVRDWISHKEENGKSYAYVTTTRELRSVDTSRTEYILGLFDEIHLPYETDRDTSLDGCPHIKEMVKVAINRLKKSDDGFFLFVEGGRIDSALHITSPKRALEELLAFEEAVELALTMVNTEETLVIVTADHSHVMTMNGYPPRGNDILGVVTESEQISDGLPFTTLTFANGHGFNYSFNGNEVVRPNLTGVDTTDKDFVSLAAMPTYYDSETHGGEDVAAFAVGPWAHLFHRVHEQTHVAHVMAYASCTGPYKDCRRHAERPFNEYKILEDQVKKLPKRGSSSGTGLLNGNTFIFMVVVQILFVWKMASIH